VLKPPSGRMHISTARMAVGASVVVEWGRCVSVTWLWGRCFGIVGGVDWFGLVWSGSGVEKFEALIKGYGAVEWQKLFNDRVYIWAEHNESSLKIVP